MDIRATRLPSHDEKFPTPGKIVSPLIQVPESSPLIGEFFKAFDEGLRRSPHFNEDLVEIDEVVEVLEVVGPVEEVREDFLDELVGPAEEFKEDFLDEVVGPADEVIEDFLDVLVNPVEDFLDEVVEPFDELEVVFIFVFVELLGIVEVFKLELVAFDVEVLALLVEVF